MDGNERMRLFCAVRLPEEVLDVLVEWQQAELRRTDVRIVRREHLHVTLAFLGRTPAERAPDVGGALREAAAAAGPIVFIFPKRQVRETRSVGMILLRDIRGTALALAEDLFSRLEALGLYVREERAWLPHITVMRFRRPPHLRLDPPAVGLGRIVPSEAAVYHSVLRSSGAQYEVLQSFALGG